MPPTVRRRRFPNELAASLEGCAGGANARHCVEQLSCLLDEVEGDLQGMEAKEEAGEGARR